MGDRHHDPTDFFRTTQPRAGITMKDNFLWPGLILLAAAFGGAISTAAVAAYGHYEWLATTVLVAAVGTVTAVLWFVVEFRRVDRIEEHWLLRRRRHLRRQRANDPNVHVDSFEPSDIGPAQG